MPTFPDVRFLAPQSPLGELVQRAIVRRDEHQGVIRDLQFIQTLHQPPHGAIHILDIGVIRRLLLLQLGKLLLVFRNQIRR